MMYGVENKSKIINFVNLKLRLIFNHLIRQFLYFSGKMLLIKFFKYEQRRFSSLKLITDFLLYEEIIIFSFELNIIYLQFFFLTTNMGITIVKNNKPEIIIQYFYFIIPNQ